MSKPRMRSSHGPSDADDLSATLTDAHGRARHRGTNDAACSDDKRVPRVVDGVVVDPCGCCRIDDNYCSGLGEGGSPDAGGGCYVVYDAVPPCVEGVDENGCRYRHCNGSCIR